VIVETGRPASSVCRQFDPLPQRLRNLRHNGISPLEHPSVRRAVAEAEAALAGRGRLLIRRSGTEPLVRVMAEAEDEALMERVLDALVGVIEGAIDEVAA
jgi:phosphoglucosamine mutase